MPHDDPLPDGFEKVRRHDVQEGDRLKVTYRPVTDQTKRLMKEGEVVNTTTRPTNLRGRSAPDTMAFHLKTDAGKKYYVDTNPHLRVPSSKGAGSGRKMGDRLVIYRVIDSG